MKSGTMKHQDSENNHIMSVKLNNLNEMQEMLRAWLNIGLKSGGDTWEKKKRSKYHFPAILYAFIIFPAT